MQLKKKPSVFLCQNNFLKNKPDIYFNVYLGMKYALQYAFFKYKYLHIKTCLCGSISHLFVYVTHHVVVYNMIVKGQWILQCYLRIETYHLLHSTGIPWFMFIYSLLKTIRWKMKVCAFIYIDLPVKPVHRSCCNKLSLQPVT